MKKGKLHRKSEYLLTAFLNIIALFIRKYPNIFRRRSCYCDYTLAILVLRRCFSLKRFSQLTLFGINLHASAFQCCLKSFWGSGPEGVAVCFHTREFSLSPSFSLFGWDLGLKDEI